MYFGITVKPTTLYNNAGLISKVTEKNSQLKIAVVDNPTVVDAPCPWNFREYPDKPYTTRNWSHWPTFFAADSVGLSSFKFLWWAPKDASFLQQSAYRPFKVIQGR